MLAGLMVKDDSEMKKQLTRTPRIIADPAGAVCSPSRNGLWSIGSRLAKCLDRRLQGSPAQGFGDEQMGSMLNGSTSVTISRPRKSKKEIVPEQLAALVNAVPAFSSYSVSCPVTCDSVACFSCLTPICLHNRLHQCSALHSQCRLGTHYPTR